MDGDAVCLVLAMLVVVAVFVDVGVTSGGEVFGVGE